MQKQLDDEVITVGAQNEELLELIRSYEDRGLRCFPVGTNKRPFEKWEPIRGESTAQRLERFRRVCEEGRAFLIAAIPGESAVIDVDDPAGFASFMGDDVVEFTGPISVTPSGGRHYWHKNGCGLRLSHFPGFDVITGDGCFAIVPGGGEASYEKGGKQICGRYEWAPGTVPLPEWEGELPEIPTELLTKLKAHATVKDSQGQPGGASKTIPEGMRNTTLTRMAGAMCRQGMGEAAILEAIRQVNEDRCNRPLPDRDVQKIAKSVSRYSPAPMAVLIRCTDTGDAQFFAHLYGDRLRYDYRRRRWLRWEEHWWEEDSDGEVYRLARVAARVRYRQAEDIEDLDLRAAVAKRATNCENRTKIEATLSLAQSEKVFADAGIHWDLDPWLFAVRNGVIDLRTGEFRPGRADDRITRHSPVIFDPEAKSPRWIQFVDEIFDGDSELQEYLQRACGYSLTGETSEQCLFLLHGSGANGKTVLFRVLQYLFGKYAYSLPFKALEYSRNESGSTEIAHLDGARLVTSEEAHETSRLDEQKVKIITGEGAISARYLYCEPFTFTPIGKFWLASNHLPVVRDDSYAFWRRVHLIPFNRQFKDDADPHLSDKLKLDAAGILAWALRGCLRWQKHGLQRPEAVQVATDNYREESDPLGEFLAEGCNVSENASVMAGDLYTAYVEWAEQRRLRKRDVLSNTMFGRRIAEKFEKRHQVGGSTYYGIELSRREADGYDGFTP